MTSRMLSRQVDDVSSRDRLVLVAIGLLPVAWLPVFVQAATPRVLVALILLPLGGLLMARRAVSGDRASIAALLFVAVALVSSSTSPAVFNSLFASLDFWTGALGVATALAWWACGRELTPAARHLVLPLLTIGALWNGVLAFAQVLLRIDTGSLGGFAGRGSGTMVNPVVYGTFVAGVLACWLARRSVTARSAVVVFALAASAGLSGGRVVAGSIALVAIWSLGRRASRRAALLNLTVVIAGLGAANALVSWRVEGRELGSRLIAGGGSGGRTAIWRMGLEAFAERPWLGWGPGNIEIAVERQFDLAYTQANLNAEDGLIRWLDTHNVAINLLVEVGLVGTLVAAAFLVCALWGRLDAVFLAGATAIAVNWMLEPVTIHTFPIALLLLGAARAAEPVRATADPAGDGCAVSATALKPGERWAATAGILVASVLLVSTAVTAFGVRQSRIAVAELAVTYGYRDAFLIGDVAAAYQDAAVLELGPDDASSRAARLAERAARHYPVVATYEQVGEIAFGAGDLAEAEAWERRALEFQPWHPAAHQRIRYLAEIDGDDQLVQQQNDVLCLIGASACVHSATPSVPDVSSTQD